MRHRVSTRVVLGLAAWLPAARLAAQAPPPAPATYRLLATAESDDQVALIEFAPCSPAVRAGAPAHSCGARVVRTYEVGIWPAETEGPHGVVATPDGKAFFVSLAHGRPFGFVQKYDTESGRLLGQVELGMFPATVDLAGPFVYSINFNFEDPDMAPSSLSIIDGATMTEVARPITCRMPHGSRVNPQRTRHYSGCMMNDLLVEVDAERFVVTRLFNVAAGHEGPVPIGAVAEDGMVAAPGMAGMPSPGPPLSNGCSPTWAQPAADGAKVYVACNRSGEIVEVDAGAWTMTRRWKTPPAPYNLAVTPDGKLLVATQKGPGTTSVWRISDAKLLADIPGTRRVASGVAVSADSRYAFVTLEGVGGDPGTVDVIDLGSLEKVSTVEMGKQAGGICLLP